MPYTYRTLTAELAAAGIEDAGTEAALLLERLAGISRAALLADRERIYDAPALEQAIARRIERYPLQYILGDWDFCGCRFRVDEHCLIPRPDTEILVEEAIRRLPPGGRAADLCTGSGCVAVAALYHRPDVTVDALELYPETLALATSNARSNGVAERFCPVCADLLKDGVEALKARAPYDAILSNPPYIPSEQLAGLAPEVHCEPQAALDGGTDGLTFYRAILRDYAALVKPGGLILLEIGWDQAADLARLAQEYLGIPQTAISVIRDLGGRDRVVLLTVPAA